jgi:signal peptidase II
MNNVQASDKPSPYWPWLVLCVVILVLDQSSKHWIKENFLLGQSSPLLEVLNVVRAHNTGAAFSFLASDEGWQRWFFSVLGCAAAAILFWIIKTHASQKVFCLALSLIMAGAMGNVIDRLLYGYVIDFLDFHWAQAHFAAFNLADSAITGGAILLIFEEFFKKSPPTQDTNTPQA